MRLLQLLILLMGLLVARDTSLAASAKCVVVKKDGNVLVIDCGKNVDGFEKNTKVKIKTDRGQR